MPSKTKKLGKKARVVPEEVSAAARSRDIVKKDYDDMFAVTQKDYDEYMPLIYGKNMSEKDLALVTKNVKDKIFSGGKVDKVLARRFGSEGGMSFPNNYSSIRGYDDLYADPMLQLREIVQAKRLRSVYDEMKAAGSPHVKGLSFDDFINKAKTKGSLDAVETGTIKDSVHKAEAVHKTLDRDFVREVNTIYAKNAYGLSPEDSIRFYKTSAEVEPTMLGFASPDKVLARSFDKVYGKSKGKRRNVAPLLTADVPVSQVPTIFGVSGYADESAVVFSAAQKIPAKVDTGTPLGRDTRDFGLGRNFQSTRGLQLASQYYPTSVPGKTFDSVMDSIRSYATANNVKSGVFGRVLKPVGKKDNFIVDMNYLSTGISKEELGLLRFIQDDLGIPLVSQRTGQGLVPAKLNKGGMVGKIAGGMVEAGRNFYGFVTAMMVKKFQQGLFHVGKLGPSPRMNPQIGSIEAKKHMLHTRVPLAPKKSHQNVRGPGLYAADSSDATKFYAGGKQTDKERYKFNFSPAQIEMIKSGKAKIYDHTNPAHRRKLAEELGFAPSDRPVEGSVYYTKRGTPSQDDYVLNDLIRSGALKDLGYDIANFSFKSKSGFYRQAVGKPNDMNLKGYKGSAMQKYKQTFKDEKQSEMVILSDKFIPQPQLFANGGTVPGLGNKDTVPALLTPGESVVTKEATQKFGPIIQAMNDGTLPGFNDGIVGVVNLDGSKGSDPSSNQKAQKANARWASMQKELELMRGVQTKGAWAKFMGKGAIPDVRGGAGGLGVAHQIPASLGGNAVRGNVFAEFDEYNKYISERGAPAAKTLLNSQDSKLFNQIRKKSGLNRANFIKSLELMALGIHSPEKNFYKTLNAVAAKDSDLSLKAVQQGATGRKTTALGTIAETGYRAEMTRRGVSERIRAERNISPKSSKSFFRGPMSRAFGPTNIKPIKSLSGLPSQLSSRFGNVLQNIVSGRSSARFPFRSATVEQEPTPKPKTPISKPDTTKTPAIVQDEPQRSKQQEINDERKQRRADAAEAKKIYQEQRRVERIQQRYQGMDTETATRVARGEVDTPERIMAQNSRNAARAGTTPKMPRRMPTALGGAAVGLGSGLMMASMAPMMMQDEQGKFMGMDANTAMFGMMGGGTLLSMLPMLVKNPALGVATAAAIALGAGFYTLKKGMDNVLASSKALGEAFSLSVEEQNKTAEIFGNKTVSLTRQQKEIEKITGLESEQQQAGKEFLGTDPGKAMLEQFKLLQSSGADVGRIMATQLSQQVASGALTIEQAKAISAALAVELGRTDLVAKVDAQITQILGPDGSNVTNKPLELSATIVSNVELDEKAAQEASTAASSFWGDNPLTESGYLGYITPLFSGEYDAALARGNEYVTMLLANSESITSMYDDQIYRQEQLVENIKKQIKTEDDKAKKIKLQNDLLEAQKTLGELQEQRDIKAEERRKVEVDAVNNLLNWHTQREELQKRGIQNAAAMLGAKDDTGYMGPTKEGLMYQYYVNAGGPELDAEGMRAYQAALYADVLSGRINAQNLQSLQSSNERPIGPEQTVGAVTPLLERIARMQAMEGGQGVQAAGTLTDIGAAMSDEARAAFAQVIQLKSDPETIEIGKILAALPPEIAVKVAPEVAEMALEDLKTLRKDIEWLQKQKVDVGKIVDVDGVKGAQGAAKDLRGLNKQLKENNDAVKEYGKISKKNISLRAEKMVEIFTGMVDKNGNEVTGEDVKSSIDQLLKDNDLTKAEFYALPADVASKALVFYVSAEQYRDQAAKLRAAAYLLGTLSPEQREETLQQAKALEDIANILGSGGKGAVSGADTPPPTPPTGGPTGGGGGSPGGGTKKSNPLKDFLKSLLERARLFAKANATMKNLFKLGITFNGWVDKLRRQGVPEYLIADFASQGAEGIKLSRRYLKKPKKVQRKIERTEQRVAASEAIFNLGQQALNAGYQRTARQRLTASGVTGAARELAMEDEALVRLLATIDTSTKKGKKLYDQLIKSILGAVDANDELISKNEEQIEKYQELNDAASDQIDLYNRDLDKLSKQEDKIREAYEKRIKALDEVAKLNDHIINQQKNQLSLADALSRGDIAAAAQTAQQMQAESARYSVEQARKGLEEGLTNIIDSLTINGMTRQDIEKRIEQLEEETYQRNLLIKTLEKQNLEADQNKESGENPTPPPGSESSTETDGTATTPDLGNKISYKEFEEYFNKLKKADQNKIAERFFGKKGKDKWRETWQSFDNDKRKKIMDAIFAKNTQQGMFAGGIVGGTGGRDLVSALLTPGEFVVRKAAVDKFGSSMLSKINDGSFTMPSFATPQPVATPQPSTTIGETSNVYNNNYEVVVNVSKAGASEDDIANKVIGKIKQLEGSSIRRQRGYR